ncbi:MAG: HD domain-containing protein [Bacteroidota bacterium]
MTPTPPTPEAFALHLDRAMALAVQAHTGQRDKAGQPYLLHVLRVAMAQTSPEAQLAGLLHDVVEDSAWTLADLEAAGFPASVLEAVALLTKPPGADYLAYIDRVAVHPIARAVKRADLQDNMDLTRLSVLTDHDLERLRRYRSAWARLDAWGAPPSR